MARTHTISAVLLCLLFTVACGASSTAPSSTNTTIILSGQSNAVQLEPFLKAAYHDGKVDGYSYGGLPIDSFITTKPLISDWSPWALIAATLHQPARAFIWWQGESDARDPGHNPYQYQQQLATFIGNVRAEANQPNLYVIVCQILEADVSDTPIIRAQTAAWVAGDRNAKLLFADDLPRNDSQHLTAEGYTQMARRVIAALP